MVASQGRTAEKPKSPDAKDAITWTAMSYAALHNDGEATEKLLDLNATVALRNRHNFSALLWAHWYKYTNEGKESDFLEVLRDKRGPKAVLLDSTDKQGFEMLKHAYENSGDTAITHVLTIDPQNDSDKKTAQQRMLTSGVRSTGSKQQRLKREKSELEKRAEDSVQGITALSQQLERRVFDPSDKPQSSLEEYLLWLDRESEYAHRFASLSARMLECNRCS